MLLRNATVEASSVEPSAADPPNALAPMPRSPRLIVPGVPVHITQRGVDRGPIFFHAEDFAFYRHVLQANSEKTACAVHAYAFMTNHTHVLLTPSDEDGPARLMGALGRRYVPYFNHRYRRSGALFEGRYHSAVLDSRESVFRCSRYIELNPVRAHLVTAPDAYEWSSFGCNALGRRDALVTPHDEYLPLGPTPEARCRAYRVLFEQALGSADLAGLRADLRRRPCLHVSPYRQLAASMSTESAPRIDRVT